MSRTFSWNLILVGLLSLGVAQPPSLTYAQEPASGEGVDEALGSSAFAEITTADALMELGRKHKSPELLVAASILMAKSHLPLSDDEGTVLAKKESDQKKQAQVEEILKEAKGMNPDDKTLLELIARTRDSLQEVSRSLTYDPALEAYRQTKFAAGARQRKAITKATNGKKVSASTTSPVAVGVIAVNTQGAILPGAKPIASGAKGVTVTIPKSGSYAVYIETGSTPVTTGTLAISTK